jgi:hypothetical protein
MEGINSVFKLFRQQFYEDILQNKTGLEIATSNYKRKVKRFIRKFVEQSDYPNEDLKRADYRKIRERLDLFIQSYNRGHEVYGGPLEYMAQKLKSTIDYVDERSFLPVEYSPVEPDPVAVEVVKPPSRPQTPFVNSENLPDLFSQPREFATAMERLQISGLAIAKPSNPKPSSTSPRSNAIVTPRNRFIGGGAPPEAYEEQEEEQ